MEDSQSGSNVFSVRIVSIDYYMAPPIPGLDICYSSFQGGKVNEVPVIRVYGSTPAGQKACLHIHRALPYLYVPCSDLLSQADQEGNAFTQVMSHAMEKALKLKSNAGSKRQHVHGCSLVRARKFYGYHSLEELFVKIYLYYPSDVSRTANLLLEGVVLDKILQPHESHIPFLLQFLVDYNLYGMGHLHVAKMKFRHPVPDIFTAIKADLNGKHRQQTDNSTFLSTDSQADSRGDACFSSSIWISSTIPDGWIWQYPSQLDPSTEQSIPVVKRQSTCELEGDAAVDEILNQQFKLYTSLSQTDSNVKMVQSLIPIWEEEFERTGVHEAAVPPDPEKPLPEDVLRTLSLGLDFDDKLMELCGDAENSSSSTPFNNDPVLTQSVRSSADDRNLVELGHVSSDDKTIEALKCLKTSEEFGFLLPQDVCEEDDAKPSEERDACEKQLSADEFKISDTSGLSDLKAGDQRALMLLKWLASSQAAEDINSDDELVCETILSPLLPATTIDKVLHKANMDYESESQQECQDIIDSVQDINHFEGSKRTSYSIANPHLCQTSSNKTIPQVDGSGDDQNTTLLTGKLSKVQMDIQSQKRSPCQVEDNIVLSTTDKCKRKRPLWGSLPVSSTQSMNCNLQPIGFNVTGRCDSEMKDDKQTCSQGGNVPETFSDVLMGGAEGGFYNSKEGSTIVGCSVRDLMRRKRCNRIELPECETTSVRITPSEKEKREDLAIYTKQRTDMKDRRPSMSSISCPSLTDEQAEFHERSDYSANSVLGACDAKTNKPNCSIYSKLPLFSSSGSSLLNTSKSEHLPSCGLVGKVVTGPTAGPGSSGINCSPPLHKGSKELPEFLNSDNQNSAIHMVHSEKCNYEQLDGSMNCIEPSTSNLCVDNPDPCVQMSEFPVEDVTLVNDKLLQTDAAGTSCLSTCIVNSKILDRDDHICESGYVSTTALQRVPETSLKDLMGVEGTAGTSLIQRAEWSIGDVGGGGILSGPSDHQEAVMSVPMHYENDGSHLYMLTPVFSPPSAASVRQWLLLDGKYTREKEILKPGEPSFPKCSSDNLVDSHSSLLHPCDESLLESFSISNVKHKLEVDQQNQGSLVVETKPFHGNAATLQQREGDIERVEQSTDCSQDHSQISGPDGKSKLTPLSQIGFRDPASVGGGQQLTLVSMEVQAESRGDLRPDPRFDAVNVIVLVIQEDDDSSFDTYIFLHCNTESARRNIDGISDCKVHVSSDEKHLFSHFTRVISTLDPDVLMGWDIQGASLGFLAERAAHLGIALLSKISRTPYESTIASRDLDIVEKGILNDVLLESVVTDPVLSENVIIEDEWGRTHASGVHVGGRIVLNIWRLMCSEVKLTMYTIEAVAEAVLRRRIPFIPHKVLTKWFSSGPGLARYRCIEYVLERAKLNLQIMNQLDMINRTSELARVFGIDFFSVLSRGSQYRVESMFLTLAHAQNYLPISPGNQQVASQPAMECLPLVMEPESGFYADPVVVLDFQSLYPSMIIAYNLCFCTCLGKVFLPKFNSLGVSPYSPDFNVLRELKHQIFLTPNGVMYVPPKIRKGVLPRLLEEILSTRVMVKRAMKQLAPSQQVLHRIFNARQLALKLIANVTYGYTAAGFSGRMPCAELADSIVQCARRTLENAISLVNTHDKWKAKVIYGDTDSMFVLLRGRSVKESFQIGHEIAAAVTATNPNPVTLKMEKVYQPCFLLTKKRYVGYSYENPDQIKPVFDAKGIETVRRDTCAAVSKTMEQSLRLFFEHQDINKVKAYLLRQWTRILSGRVSLQDFIFAKEVRLGTYNTRAASLPPAAIVATKAMRADPRAEPRYAERIPYVVVHGEPGARLVDMVVDPLDLLAINSPLRLNDLYYINKQIIPALQRVFGLVGADLNLWFSDMPRPGREAVAKRQTCASNPHRTRIDFYYLSKHCLLCGQLVLASAYLCGKCSKNESLFATVVICRTSKLEREIQHLSAICRQCGGGDWLVESGVKCTSLACCVLYERRKIQKELQSLSGVAAEAGLYPRCISEWF